MEIMHISPLNAPPPRIVIKYLVEYRMKENPTFNIVEVDTMSATCSLRLNCMHAIG